MSSLSLTVVPLAGGPGLAVHYAEGPLRPFLLLHDTGRDSQTWHDVAVRLNRVGHAVAAIDLRDHGDSDPSAFDRSAIDRSAIDPAAVDPAVLDLTDPASPSYDDSLDLDGAADDVAHLIETLDLRGRRAPIAVGHGRGGNIALSLAARRGGVSAVACVDGGWDRPDVSSEAGPDPRAWFPLIGVPVLLCPALPAAGQPDPAGRGASTRTAVTSALHRLPGANVRVSWYPGTGHDIPAAAPARLTEDLLKLAERAEPGPADPSPLRSLPGHLPGYLPLLRAGAGGPEAVTADG